MKKILGPFLLLALIGGVGYAIWTSVVEKVETSRVVAVKGLIGSEKEEFFRDPRVIDRLRKTGFEVGVEKAGSRQIATLNLKDYDFGFPGGFPAAEKIRLMLGKPRSFDVFFTPMAVASWKPIAEMLEANGLATRHDGYYTLRMEPLMKGIGAGKRWRDLVGHTAYPVNKRILITSTDVRKSNSAAMFLALASYVANGNNVVQSDSEMVKVQPAVEALFLNQGFSEYSSESTFEDYLVMGMGKSPLAMVYESQFLSRAAKRDGGVTAEMVLMYPEPTVFTKHILVPVSENGRRLGELLTTDPELQKLAVEYGFRTGDPTAFKDFIAAHGLKVPLSIVEVVEPPDYGTLEGMILAIEKKYK